MPNSYSYETIRIVNNQWMHLVLNFIGPKKEEGMELFRDGALITSYQTQIEYQLTPGGQADPRKMDCRQGLGSPDNRCG